MDPELILLVSDSGRLVEVKDISGGQIPARPQKSVLAYKYLRLENVYEKLQRQNSAISEKEQKLENLEAELQECKDIFKGKRRKELREEIEQSKNHLEPMKQR